MVDSSLSNGATSLGRAALSVGPWKRNSKEPLCVRTVGSATRCLAWQSGALIAATTSS